MSIEGKNIKDYYEEIMQEWKNADGSYKGYRCEWYDRYNYIIEMVRKKKLEIDKRKLDANIDREFLKFLLLERDNGIADSAKGQLADEQFENFIKESDIIETIEGIIKAPNLRLHRELHKHMKACNKAKRHTNRLNQRIENNWLIANRVAAACTTDISSTVSLEMFSEVFGELVKNGIIDDYSTQPIFPNGNTESRIKALDGDFWYGMNIHLMKELSKHFAEELDNGKMDPILLSVFVWEIWVDNFRKQ